jgi:hypothetical protein
MTWYPPGKSRERVLVYGPTGSFKTAGAFTIAAKVFPHTMFVVDTDNSWELLQERVWPDVENLDIATCAANDWPATRTAIQRAFEGATPDDWVVLDSVSGMWDQVTNYMTRQIVGEDLPQFLLDWRVSLDEKKVGKENKEGAMKELYNFINPEWHSVVSGPVKSATCHVYMTAEGQTSGNPYEDKGTRQMFGDFGLKPRAQKGISFNAATVLLLGRDKMGRGEYSTVKNWGRADDIRDQGYEDMARELLFKNGWRPRPGGTA